MHVVMNNGNSRRGKYAFITLLLLFLHEERRLNYVRSLLFEV